MPENPLLVENYRPAFANANVIVEKSYATLSALDRAQGHRSPLLVWQHGFLNEALSEHFSRPDWPLEFIKAFATTEWQWLLKHPEGSNTGPLEPLLARAAGIEGPPMGNIHLTLELRNYAARHADTGGTRWWEARADLVRGRSALGDAFIRRLLEMLSEVADCGHELFVEQLSIILSKDTTAAQTTLTPFLHSDIYYGARETAIVSLLEAGWEGMGGALFMPDAKMIQFGEDDESIDLQAALNLACEHPLWKTYSGDILIYDGQIKDGVACGSRGVPHISPDLPGYSARLCVLMHHKPSTLEDSKV